MWVRFWRSFPCKLFREPVRGEKTWAIATLGRSTQPRFRTELPYFSREKRPEFRRKRDLCEPLLTAMAQVLPFLGVRNSFRVRGKKLMLTKLRCFAFPKKRRHSWPEHASCHSRGFAKRLVSKRVLLADLPLTPETSRTSSCPFS